jgi:hypothetical protein
MLSLIRKKVKFFFKKKIKKCVDYRTKKRKKRGDRQKKVRKIKDE